MSRVQVAPMKTPSYSKAMAPQSGVSAAKGRKARAASRTAGLVVTRSMKAPPPAKARSVTPQEKSDAPQRGDAHRAAEARAVARTHRLAAHLFGRGGEAVEEVGRHEEEVHQHGVGGQQHVAAPRALRGEEGEGEDQRGRAHHDVAVDAQHAQERGAVAERRTVDPEPPLQPRQHGEPDGGADALGHERPEAEPRTPRPTPATSATLRAMLDRLISTCRARPRSVRPRPITAPSTA